MIKKIFGQSIGIYTLPNAESYDDDLIKFAYHMQKLEPVPDNLRHQFIHRAHLIPGYPLKFLDGVMWAFDQYVKECKLTEIIQFPYQVPYISSAWLNVIKPNEFIKSHNHMPYNSRFNVTYYPKFLEKQGDLYIETEDRTSRQIVPSKKGCCVIFPSYIQHHTEVNKSSEDRISVACDIKMLGLDSDLPPTKLVEEITSTFTQELNKRLDYERKMDN